MTPFQGIYGSGMTLVSDFYQNKGLLRRRKGEEITGDALFDPSHLQIIPVQQTGRQGKPGFFYEKLFDFFSRGFAFLSAGFIHSAYCRTERSLALNRTLPFLLKKSSAI